MTEKVARLINSTTMLIPVDRSHSTRYVIGAVYVAGGYSVPCSQYQSLCKYYALPQALRSYCEQQEVARGIADEIKSNIVVKPDAPDFLMEHQKKAYRIAAYCPKYAFFMDTGTGKTATMLAVIDAHRNIPWVVMCPKSIMVTAWRDDSNKFFPDLRVFVWDVDTKKTELQELAEKWGIAYSHSHSKKYLWETLKQVADIVVINPEQFTVHHAELEHDGFIIDESTLIKNPSSKLSKAVDQYVKACSRVYILSGEPAPNGVEDYFNQMKILDPSVLGTGFTAFKQRYFIPTGYMGYDITPKEGAVEEISRRVATMAYMVKKEDCLDLPDKTYEVRTFRLPPDARKMYQTMLDDFIAMAEGADDMVVVFNKAGSLMKLRQIASGFLINGDTNEINEVHTMRIQLLEEVLREIGNKQVIIWAQFRHEVETLFALLSGMGKTVCTGYGGTKNLQDSIDGFKTGKYQYIIAHPATLKFGVTFTNATYAIDYSYSYNYEEYYQSHDRNYRIGQKEKCTYITLKCIDTIDEAMLKAVRTKSSVASMIADLIRMGKGDKDGI